MGVVHEAILELVLPAMVTEVAMEVNPLQPDLVKYPVLDRVTVEERQLGLLMEGAGIAEEGIMEERVTEKIISDRDLERTLGILHEIEVPRGRSSTATEGEA